MPMQGLSFLSQPNPRALPDAVGEKSHSHLNIVVYASHVCAPATEMLSEPPAVAPIKTVEQECVEAADLQALRALLALRESDCDHLLQTVHAFKAATTSCDSLIAEELINLRAALGSEAHRQVGPMWYV